MAANLTVAQVAVAIRAVPDGGSIPQTVTDVLDILVPAAAAIVEAYASGAPTAVANAALVRLTGWLWDSDPADTSTGRALQNSGAAALLAQWRRQRAGALVPPAAVAPVAPGAGIPEPPGEGHFILSAKDGGLAWVEFPEA